MPKINSSFKISTTILFVFTFLIGVVALSILVLQYYFSKELAYKATQNSVKFISHKAQDKVNSLNLSTYDTISLLELTNNIEQFPQEKIKHSMLKKFTKAIVNKPYTYAMYIGYENGNFYEVINLNIDPKLRKKYNATSLERWLAIKIYDEKNKKIVVEEFLDKKLNIVRSVKREATYNPTKRPWYKKALQESGMIKTAPYIFSNLGSMGVTYSKQLENTNSVISIDIALNSLSNFLKDQEVFTGTKIYIFNKKEQKIIASNLQDNTNGELKDKLNSFITQNTNSIIQDGKTYFVSNISLDSKYSDGEYLVMLIPQEEIMKPYNEKIILSLYANLMLMILILPMIWYASKIIVNPIKNLEKENNKIKDRKFDDVQLVSSPIKEINELSSSIVSMAQSIKTYEEAQIKLMDSFIELIASAIDKKSEYTGGHGQRVPIITMMLAEHASDKKDGIFKSFTLKDEEEIRELKIAALLHDCGKITTPEYVVDKSTKLETIYNRIHEVRTRFEVVYRDLEILYYKKLQNTQDKDEVLNWLKEEQQKLKDDFEFIAQCNIGGEFMSDEYIKRIEEISKITWSKNFDDTLGISQDERDRLSSEDNSNIENILSDKTNHIIKRTSYFQDEYENDGFKGEVPENLYNLGEVYNLTVKRGTLTEEERFKINEHVIMTIKMLEQLPFPDQLKKVPEYAGAHHETLIGTGYPKQLTKEQMSIPARIMAIADVFEALTASDRPYKEPKKLSEAIKILSFMVKDQHIDKDLFELFLTSGVYKEYGEKFLQKEQVDFVDVDKFIG